jgi:hypothetical protein
VSAERWLPVPGYAAHYEVSSLGRVRTACRRLRRGCLEFAYPSRFLATSSGGRAKNYLRVNLCAGGKRRFAYVHALVLEAFVGPRPEGLQICHSNDDGTDNRLSNLYYGTREDNEMDRYVKRVAANLEEAPF